LVLLLLIGFSLPGVLSQGDRLYYSSARSLGIGGVSEVLEYGDNPASLSIPDNPFILLSGALLRASEKRGLRVYDSYGNNMGISTIADNASLYSGLGSSAIILPFKAFGLGFKYTPLWDFHYRYRFESRDDFYQVVRIEENDYNGSIDGLGPMAGVNLGIVRLGVEATYLVGRKNDETKIILPQAEDSIRQTFVRYHGYTSKMGVLVIPTSQFRFSYSIRFKYTMAADEGDGLDYPICHSFGCMYQPPSRLPTRLFLELDYEAWTDPVLFRSRVRLWQAGLFKCRFWRS
jgi:hypothetical protein